MSPQGLALKSRASKQYSGTTFKRVPHELVRKSREYGVKAAALPCHEGGINLRPGQCKSLVTLLQCSPDAHHQTPSL